MACGATASTTGTADLTAAVLPDFDLGIHGHHIRGYLAGIDQIGHHRAGFKNVGQGPAIEFAQTDEIELGQRAANALNFGHERLHRNGQTGSTGRIGA